jgi:hypothetical protein
MSRHHRLLTSAVISLSLSACSMISGSSTSKSPHSVADSYGEATELPVSLRNMKKLGERIDVELTRLEEGTSTGKIAHPGSDLSFLRTNMTRYYGYGHKGGSEECEACKNHPTFPGLKDRYGQLDQRLRVLETKYNKCTYGYQMANGDILKPTYEWSAEEWAAIRKKSKHGTSRCWLNDDPEHYKSAND